MSKVNFMLDITDEMIDEAALQLLKNKIRQAINAEIEEKLNGIIDEIVSQKVKSMMLSLNSRYGWGKESAKQLDKIILEKIADFHISQDAVWTQVQKMLNPVYDRARKSVAAMDAYISEKTKEIDCRYNEQVFLKAIDILGSTFSKALNQTTDEKTEEQDGRVE